MRELNPSVEFANKTGLVYSAVCKPLCQKLHLPQTAFDILMFLANNPNYTTARDIVEVRHIKANLVSVNVDKLVQEGFLKAGEVFKFVRFCAPLNSQDKYAEPLNGAFKTTIAHKNHEGVGRWYGKGARRVDQKKISDSGNHTYEDRKYYTFEELVADDRRDCAEWNNTLHPNQKKYPGMTRWDVLVARINPTLRPLDKLTLSRYIGERVETSVRRNSTVRVAYADWWLSGPEVLEKLEPNNRKVTAFYLPDEEGKPTDVFLYQNDRYIDKVRPVVTYSRVMAEQTEEDKAAYTEQAKIMSHFDKWVRDNAIGQVGVAPVQREEEDEETESLVLPTAPVPEEPDEAYEWQPTNMAAMAIGDM